MMVPADPKSKPISVEAGGRSRLDFFREVRETFFNGRAVHPALSVSSERPR
jgi:hypothetical protein